MIEYRSVMLSLNRALWGEVSASLHAVQFIFDEIKIEIFYYFKDVAAHEDVDSAQNIGSSVAADFPQHKVLDHCISLGLNESVPKNQGYHLAFLRKDT